MRARELLDEFFEKQDEPQYMRNVLSGLSGIMLVGLVFTIINLDINAFVLQRVTRLRADQSVCWANPCMPEAFTPHNLPQCDIWHDIQHSTSLFEKDNNVNATAVILLCKAALGPFLRSVSVDLDKMV